MQRREFFHKGIMATLGMATLPALILPHPLLHFIAIDESGGRILEALFKNGLRGRYTWIKSQDHHICQVPDLYQITIEHPFSTNYFTAHRITKMPSAYAHGVPDWNRISRKGEQHIILTQPTCYRQYEDDC